MVASFIERLGKSKSEEKTKKKEIKEQKKEVKKQQKEVKRIKFIKCVFCKNYTNMYMWVYFGIIYIKVF